MPEPTSLSHAVPLMTLKQSVLDNSSSREVPSVVALPSSTEKEKAASAATSPTKHAMTTPQQQQAASSMPPPALPPAHFAQYLSRQHQQLHSNSSTPSSSLHSTFRAPFVPTALPSVSAVTLAAPKPQQMSSLQSSYPDHADYRMRVRKDGFLLDDEESEDLDLSINGAEQHEAITTMQRAASTGAEELDTFNMSEGMNGVLEHRPHSADPSYSSISTVPAQSSSSVEANVCPSCQTKISDHAEESFHAHVSKCFLAANGPRSNAPTPSPGRPPRSPMDQGHFGPIRKTRRAASAASSTVQAAELASALATATGATAGVTAPSTPEIHSHGYHPYNSASTAQTLSNTLRQLRKTVDQLDLHQRLSFMEAFHRLARQASTEHQQALTPRGTKLRSATNSPSPKHKPHSDKVCKDILSLLYSPRLTAPHPSPSVAMSGLHIGVPSPLAIGLSGASLQRSTLSVPSTMGSPLLGNDSMESLELGEVHTPLKQGSPLLDESLITTPSTIDGETTHSALSLTGAFVVGLNSGSSSPSEQTSVSSASSPAAVEQRAVVVERFPAHCFPAETATRIAIASAGVFDKSANVNMFDEKETDEIIGNKEMETVQ